MEQVPTRAGFACYKVECEFTYVSAAVVFTSSDFGTSGSMSGITRPGVKQCSCSSLVPNIKYSMENPACRYPCSVRRSDVNLCGCRSSGSGCRCSKTPVRCGTTSFTTSCSHDSQTIKKALWLCHLQESEKSRGLSL